LSPSAFHCAAAGGEEAVEALNRTNFKHWRRANAKSEEKTLIKRHHPPLNVLGSYKHPDAPVIDLAPSKPATSENRKPNALFTDDRLDIPDFLRRTARAPETLSTQNPPQAARVRKKRAEG
jgi:hypothetical protein